MKTVLTLAVMSAVSFAGGLIGVFAAAAIAGGMLLSQGALVSGGAFDPISAAVAVGLGGAALARLRSTEPELETAA